MHRIKPFVYLVLGCMILIMSFGCSADSNDEVVREASKNRGSSKLLEGYGGHEIDTAGVQLPTIK
jgi:hypothetical protein